ncbi:MAG: hypothetical protein JWO08_4568 [Verrucomicrobiaceae bacterium]|nr:hypothetical protein [Verrucomicrobiaceae bacterium]
MMAFRSFLPNSLARGRLPGKERSRRKGVKNERAKKSQAMGTCHPLSAFCLVSTTPTTLTLLGPVVTFQTVPLEALIYKEWSG